MVNVVKILTTVSKELRMSAAEWIKPAATTKTVLHMDAAHSLMLFVAAMVIAALTALFVGKNPTRVATW